MSEKEQIEAELCWLRTTDEITVAKEIIDKTKSFDDLKKETASLKAEIERLRGGLNQMMIDFPFMPKDYEDRITALLDGKTGKGE